MDLSPSQQATYAKLKAAVASNHLVLLKSTDGCGRSTLVAQLQKDSGGCVLTLRDLYARIEHTAHAYFDDELLELFEQALADHDLVIFDDFEEVLVTLVSGIGHERAFFWMGAAHALFEDAKARGKCLVLTGVQFKSGGGWDISPFLAAIGASVTMEPLALEDYRFFMDLWLSESGLAKKADVRHLYEHASKLTPVQIKALASLAVKHGRADDDFLRDTVDHRLSRADTDTSEVERLSFTDLKGFDHIAEQLKTYVVTPLADDSRFKDLDLRPKRGVLLYGPPGTGKTSVGRALARQMQGKFFLIDGTIVTDPSEMFYNMIKWIFDAAKRAAPSVVFIDDADVLFQSDRGTGLGRYLLTMLDGLESETAGKVAVVLTAMNPNHLPPALLRSGRVELWLETKPPAEAARAEMLTTYLGTSRDIFARYDAKHGAALTDGFTAADMRRLAMDVKAFYARDVLADKEPAAVKAYVETAVADVQRAREVLAGASGSLV